MRVATLIFGERSSGGVNRWILEKASSLLVSREERSNFVLECRVTRARVSQEPLAFVRWTQQRRLKHVIDAFPSVSHRRHSTRETAR